MVTTLWRLTTRRETWSDRRVAFAVFLILFTAYVFIGPGLLSTTNSNVVTRMGLAYAIVDHRTLIIDQFSPFTRDKAEFDGHYYAVSAPGMSLMAIAPLSVFLSILRALGVPSAPIIADKLTDSYHVSVLVVSALTSALLTALAGGALYLLAIYAGASRTAALFGALVFGLATPAMGWATTFFSHASAGALLIIAFACIVYGSDSRGIGRDDLLKGLLAGATLGWSIVVEYTSTLAVAVLATFGFYRLSILTAGRRKRLAFAAVIGGTFAILPLAAYDFAAFGSVFHIGYENAVGFPAMRQGFFGIALPRLNVLSEIVFGLYRGILWFCPLLVLAPIAYWSAFRKFSLSIALVSLAVPVCYLLINSGYYYWDGGYSTGPRFVTPALPFICLAFAPLWDSSRSSVRAVLMTLAFLSGALSLICASVDMQAPQGFSAPLFQYIIPSFLEGRIHHLFTHWIPGLFPLIGLAILWGVDIMLVAWLPRLQSPRQSLL